MIIKYWHGASIIKQATQKRYIPKTSQSCINRRIRTARELISGHFENEAALLLKDIRKAMSKKPASSLPEFQTLAQIHIDQLWMNCAKEYASLCTFSYLDSIQGKTPAVTEKSAGPKSAESAFVKSFCDMTQKAITDYYEQRIRFTETVLAVTSKAGDDFGALKEQVITTFRKGSNWLGDIAHEVRIQSTMGSPERNKVEQEIEDLVKENDENNKELLNVSPKKLYSFYAFGGDATAQLYEYMHKAELKYAYMHKRTWFENLLEFKSLVENGADMDLKNQPEWQHSAYVFNGEIVDQDALGNINYGYFGKYCNIPNLVLLLGAGYAQWRAGTAQPYYWFTFLDDPRDNNRVMQGIEIYETIH